MFRKKLTALMTIISLFVCSTVAMAGYPTLRLGDSGEEVRKMQQKLRSIGYHIKVDGKFGEGTLREVKRFQKASGLNMDGAAGNSTLEKLYGEKAPSNYSPQISSSSKLPSQLVLPNASLRKGDGGDDVRYMQLALKQLNYGCNDKLGTFGNSTEGAVKRFQRKYKLNSDGVAGDSTLKLLYSKCGISVSGRVKSSKEIGNNNSSGSSNDQTIIDLDSATIPSYSLREGMSSDYVRDMQIALAKLGFYRGNYDGKYGSGTISSVKAFQRKYRLSQDGIAGVATLKQIYKKAGVKYSIESNSQGNPGNSNNPSNKIYITSATIPNQSLRLGQKNSFVKEMQLALLQIGYNVGRADGNFGSGTKSVLMKFQKDNRLRADGIAGKGTLTRLYGKANVSISYQQDNTNNGNNGGNNNSSNGNTTPSQSIPAPSIGNVRLLKWFTEVKPQLRYGNKVKIYDPVSNQGYELTVLSTGRHLDAEPTTAQDTESMNRIFGGRPTWTPKIVYAQLPNGQWSLASTHNMPHLSGNIKDNNFNGHLCVHFLRDMAETQQNDPHYGVQNQNNLRNAWKRMTGETIE